MSWAFAQFSSYVLNFCGEGILEVDGSSHFPKFVDAVHLSSQEKGPDIVPTTTCSNTRSTPSSLPEMHRKGAFPINASSIRSMRSWNGTFLPQQCVTLLRWMGRRHWRLQSLAFTCVARECKAKMCILIWGSGEWGVSSHSYRGVFCTGCLRACGSR